MASPATIFGKGHQQPRSLLVRSGFGRRPGRSRCLRQLS